MRVRNEKKKKEIANGNHEIDITKSEIQGILLPYVVIPLIEEIFIRQPFGQQIRSFVFQELRWLHNVADPKKDLLSNKRCPLILDTNFFD